MDAPLQHIFYVSRSLAQPLDLEQILARARVLNGQRRLTGSLLFTGGHFAQWLEGPAGPLADTMAAIAADRRHDSVRVCAEGGLATRRFPAWTMGYAEAPGVDDVLASLATAETLAPERIERLLARLFKP